MNIQEEIKNLETQKRKILSSLNIDEVNHIYTLVDMTQYEWCCPCLSELSWIQDGQFYDGYYPSEIFETEEYITFLFVPDIGSEPELYIFSKSIEKDLDKEE